MGKGGRGGAEGGGGGVTCRAEMVAIGILEFGLMK